MNNKMAFLSDWSLLRMERIVSLFLVSARAFVVLAPGDWLRPPLRAQTNSSQWRRSADCDRGLLL
eukprot:jgi/Pico_ML_1/54162/g4576.t1